MDGLTISDLLGLWLGAIKEYLPLITAVIGGSYFLYKHLKHRAIKADRSNELLTDILESSVSTEKTIKEMSNEIQKMNTEQKILRNDHDALANSHRSLKKKVEYIERNKK